MIPFPVVDRDEMILLRLEYEGCADWSLDECVEAAETLNNCGHPLPLDLQTRLLGLGVDLSKYE